MAPDSPLRHSGRVLAAGIVAILIEILALLWAWRDRDPATIALLFGLYGLASLIPCTVMAILWLRRTAVNRGRRELALECAALTTLAVAVDVLVIVWWQSTIPIAEIRARTVELWIGPPSVAAALIPSLSHVVSVGADWVRVGRDLVLSAVAVTLVLRWVSG
jgi:hypothetical protein